MAAEQNRSSPGATQENDVEMERCGITRAHFDVYSCREYRYPNVRNAVAQAGRDQARRGVRH